MFSLELAFKDDLVSLHILFICFILYLLDIIIKMNTAFYEFGVYVKDRRRILRKYFRQSFFCDFLSILAFILGFLKNPILFPTKLLFFSSYKNLRSIFCNFREQFKAGELSELILLLFRLISIAHFLGCFWHLIGNYSYQNGQDSWISPYIDNDWSVQYLLSIYWAMTSLCTVGYGDIVPKSSLEMSFAIVVMLMGTLVFGYSVTCVGILMNKMGERSKDFREKMTIIEDYLEKTCLNEKLKTKVKQYLQYIWRTEDKNYEKGEELITKLPAKMREQILKESRGKFLKGFKILKNNFSEEIIEKLALNIVPNRYSPCEIIFKVVYNNFIFKFDIIYAF